MAKAFSERDIFVGCSHGGVGYGDVLERDPQQVIRDLREEIISEWVVRNVYRVVYDPVTLHVQEDETQERRSHARKERIKKGMNYRNFVKGWGRRKPPEDILKYYGKWPDASGDGNNEQSGTNRG
jgi:acetophenone carboxylase